MAYIAENRLTISLADFMAFVAGKVMVGGPAAVLVTIDDGLQSLCTTALPILREYAVPAVAFVPVGKLRVHAGQRSDPASPEPYLTWDDLQTAAANGVDIGSHAWTHRSLGDMARSEAVDEAARSREELEQRLGRPVTAFAYPFGTRTDFNTTTREVLHECGYTCAFTSQHGAVAPNMDPLTLPRIKVEGGDGNWVFNRALQGGLDAWRWVDHWLWRLQARTN